MRFEKGDRIIITDMTAPGCVELESEIGTVLQVGNHGLLCVEFDSPIPLGHDGGGLGKMGHVYWIAEYGASYLTEGKNYSDDEDLEISYSSII